MWKTPGEIVVDRERHTVQSSKFMLTVVRNPIAFHVRCSESPPEGAQIHCTILYNIIQMISWSQSQIGGGRPGRLGRTGRTGEHDWTSCGCILIKLDHTPRKCQGITSVSIEWNSDFISLFARFGTLGLFLLPSSFFFLPSSFFLLGYVKGKLMDITLKLHPNFLFVFGLFWWKSCGRPWTQFFSNEWMEGLQKCVEVDGAYVGWAKRTQYIEIDFNYEICLCYTWRGTPYIWASNVYDCFAESIFDVSLSVDAHGCFTLYYVGCSPCPCVWHCRIRKPACIANKI
jgi:hypothetical protein